LRVSADIIASSDEKGDMPLIHVLPRLHALEGIHQAPPHVLGTACMHGQLGHGWLLSRFAPAGKPATIVII